MIELEFWQKSTAMDIPGGGTPRTAVDFSFFAKREGKNTATLTVRVPRSAFERENGRKISADQIQIYAEEFLRHRIANNKEIPETLLVEMDFAAILYRELHGHF